MRVLCCAVECVRFARCIVCLIGAPSEAFLRSTGRPDHRHFVRVAEIRSVRLRKTSELFLPHMDFLARKLSSCAVSTVALAPYTIQSSSHLPACTTEHSRNIHSVPSCRLAPSVTSDSQQSMSLPFLLTMLLSPVITTLSELHSKAQPRRPPTWDTCCLLSTGLTYRCIASPSSACSSAPSSYSETCGSHSHSFTLRPSRRTSKMRFQHHVPTSLAPTESWC
jgi:hypothetical protein